MINLVSFIEYVDGLLAFHLGIHICGVGDSVHHRGLKRIEVEVGLCDSGGRSCNLPQVFVVVCTVSHYVALKVRAG